MLSVGEESVVGEIVDVGVGECAGKVCVSGCVSVKELEHIGFVQVKRVAFLCVSPGVPATERRA